MSWLSTALKRNHLDVLNKIAKPIQAIANPIVDAIPVVGQIKQGAEFLGNYVPGAPKPVGEDVLNAGINASTGFDPETGQPYPGTNVSTLPAGVAQLLGQGGKGLPSSGLTAADWLKAISGSVGAGLDYKSKQSELEEAKNQFARKQAQDELKTAASAQNLINRAPMADNAQALLRARMGSAPTTFAPRDFTRGPISQASMAAPATGGPQDQLASAGAAAANYRPGQGGVDTSVLEMLKKRMLANSGTRTA